MPAPKNYRQLEGSERHLPRGARRLGAADPAEVLDVTILARRRPDGPPLPEGAMARRHPGHLPREEFAARYGAAQSDIDRVAAFARANGLDVVSTNLARRTVVVSGSVAKMNQAFAVDLGRYESPTQTYRGREGSISVPCPSGEVHLQSRRRA